MKSQYLLGGLMQGQLKPHAKTCRASLRRNVVTRVQAQSGDFGDNFKKLAKQLQGSLPIVGLISRLASPEGGVGSDQQAYPEFCRAAYDAAPLGFQIAVAELQNKYGKPCQRKYVLLVLWMARRGAGVLTGKSIADAARRIRFSQDIEFEMERFQLNIQEVYEKYTYLERPTGSLQQQADVAVDALARLCMNLPDGEPFTAEDAKLIEDAACGAFWELPDAAREQVQRAVQTREQRKEAYLA